MTTRSKKAATADSTKSANQAGSEPLNLKKSVDLWLAGEWALLAAYDEAFVSKVPDRGMIAAHIACAHQFSDDHPTAEEWTTRAVEWGCSENYLTRVLLSCAHLTMARMAVIAGDAVRARDHITQTVDPISGEAARAKAEARLSKELTELGLLHMAAQLVGEDLEAVIDQPLGHVNRHRVNILKSELIQIRQQLALSQARGQLGQVAEVGAQSDAERAKRFSTSQLGQDLWVLERTGYKRDGFFVEFGATDGVLLSNTFVLEKHFDWSGLLAEPNPEYFAELQKNRSGKTLDTCIAGRTGDKVEFVMADEFGGIKDYIGRDRHAHRRASYAELPEAVLVLTTLSLDDFLKQNKAPRKIDYISVDTEGNELDILSAFPFDSWDVQMWSVEHNFTEDREKIFDLMSSHGYLRKEVRFDDWYYKADTEE